MHAVSGPDFRQVIGFIHESPRGSRSDPLPRATLRALGDVIPADSIEYFELRRVDRALLAYSDSDDFIPIEGVDEAILAFGHQNPLNWRRWHPADGALRLSQVIRRRDLERLEFYRYALRPRRIQDELKIWIWSSPESAACVDLIRLDANFSERDQGLLNVLQHHLIEMRTTALAGLRPPIGDSPRMTLREAEIMTWVARGLANEEIADTIGISAATIRKHLEHVFEKLGARTRTEAIWLLTTPDA